MHKEIEKLTALTNDSAFRERADDETQAFDVERGRDQLKGKRGIEKRKERAKEGFLCAELSGVRVPTDGDPLHGQLKNQT